MDSGAEDSVVDPDQVPGDLIPSAMSKANRSYRAANRTPIPNLGQKAVHFQTDEGHACGIPFQCARVEKPLIAATQLAEAGNEVILHKRDGVIRNIRTKKEIKLQRRGGVYILKMWIRDTEHQNGEKSEPAGFPRPGR